MKPDFARRLKSESENLSNVGVSVVIRTLNEARHLASLLQAIAEQDTEGLEVEVVLVDSGSTDGTLAIAERFGCHIQHIGREEFSFGRSLNIGCAAARGDILVFTSGHCVPADTRWLRHLCQPILEGKAQYSYGRQVGGPTSFFSETRIFGKYFPERSAVPQEGFYCNNANAALAHGSWVKYRFDEGLTGLEDMALAKRLVADGGRVAYVAEACVLHHHDETWPQVRRRFEREAIALQQIMPQVHVNLLDVLRYVVSSVWLDWRAAAKSGDMRSSAWHIVRYRWNQYIGVFMGNHEHRRLSHAQKDRYFFPD
ncbi:MAG: glycosyltransferase [Proteobacteria bacterium]|nr:glycosyltransferase [Pseudomonadota bacterium]